uniref:Uncharacterized protein n=1 Tax=Caenorhabditis japonica TaxID=281687 RepID=A0A8R1EEG7_CAEJA
MPRDITTGDQELAMADLTKQISTLVAALSKLRQVGTASEHQGTDTTKLADLVLLSVKSSDAARMTDRQRSHHEPIINPDLNPMDFSVWGMLEGKIAGKVFATVDDLKAALEVAWASIDDGYLRRTVNSVKKRLRACVKARGSNFEILL